MKAMFKNLTQTPSQVSQDPLYVIFEQHLYNFQDSDSDRKTFIENIVKDYLTYLRRLKIAIPKYMESAIIDELGSQVNTMLVKKIYGCLTIQDFQAKAPKDAKRNAKRKYSKMKSP